MWHWDGLRYEPKWYEDIIIPAVDQFRGDRRSDQAERSKLQPEVYVERNFSDSSDDAHDEPYSSESEDSYERVCDENEAGQVLNMCENLRLG